MTTSAHILITDDDREIRELLSQFLRKHGYRVTSAADGVEMQRLLAEQTFALIVLDIMLPGEDGLSLCRHLRASSIVPIIMLTAVDEDMDRIIGLEMGADDYVTKPFNPRELLARIKAVLRRVEYGGTPSLAARVFRFGDWVLDLGKRELRTLAGTLVSLTAGEFDLLLAFVEHPQQVLSREQLLDYTKGCGASPIDRSIDVQLSRLRRKIEHNPKAPSVVKTIRGGGYMFTLRVNRD